MKQSVTLYPCPQRSRPRKVGIKALLSIFHCCIILLIFMQSCGPLA